MIAPMLAGVVYFYRFYDLMKVLERLNVTTLYIHSYWAQLADDGNQFAYVDCHCIAGLTSFANAFKIVVTGRQTAITDDPVLVDNMRTVRKHIIEVWRGEPGRRLNLIVGQVIDTHPPRSAWVDMDSFIKGDLPGGFPAIDYREAGGRE